MNTVHDAIQLPLTWYERPTYKPRVEGPGGSSWFPLALADLRLDLASCHERARDASSKNIDRQALVESIEGLHASWKLPRPREVQRSLEGLAEPDTACVVSGQQPGFLGGPLYTLYKALHTIALSRAIEESTGIACIPVFWVASEDHDIDEVRTARFGPESGEALELSLPHPDNRRPLSARAVDGATEELLDRAVEHLDGIDSSRLGRKLVELWRGRNLAAGFAAMLAELLGPEGLVVVAPEAFRSAAAPLLRRVIESPEAVLDAVRAGADSVEARGLEPFVRPRLPLFLFDEDGSRHHLSPRPQGSAPSDFGIDGTDRVFSRASLLELLESDPGRFSNGALLRPLVQESVLPCAFTVGGAAEVGYFAQLGPLAELLGVRHPGIVLRYQATLLSEPAAVAWKNLALDPERFARAQRLEDHIPQRPWPAALSKLGELRATFDQTLRDLAEELPAERRGIERGRDGTLKAIDKLLARGERAWARSDGDLVEHAERLQQIAFPDGNLQERHCGWLGPLARFGMSLIDGILRDIERDPLPLAHRLLHVDDTG